MLTQNLVDQIHNKHKRFVSESKELNDALNLRRQAWFALQNAEGRLSNHVNEHALAVFRKAERAYINAHRVYKQKEILLSPHAEEDQS